MKKRFTRGLIIALCMVTCLKPAFALDNENPKDSVIIQFDNNSRILIYFENRKELEHIQKYNLNQILEELSLSIDSSGNQGKQLTLIDRKGKIHLQDTSIVVNQVPDPEYSEPADPGNFREFAVSHFKNINLGQNFEVFVRQGSPVKVMAGGKPEDLESVSTNVQNQTLSITRSKGKKNNNNIQIMITMPNLENLNLHGESRLSIKGFEQDLVEINISGASSAHLEIKAETLKANISGASKLNLKGEGSELIAEVSGASSLHAFNYLVNNVDIDVTGASKAYLHPKEKLKANASGAGKISYKGNPRIIAQKSSSESEISKEGMNSSMHDTDPDQDKAKPKNVTGHHFNLELGFNNYLQNGRFPEAYGEDYALNPLGSRYVALSSIFETHTSGPLSFQWGGSLSWYNFRFDDPRIRAFNEDGITFFEPVVTANNGRRSKLTAVYLNASLVPMLYLGKGASERTCNKKYRHSGFRVGLGGYAGYRIDSYSKFVYIDNGDRRKDRDKGNFALNNFRYGARFQAGYKGVDIFVNYDLNNLFIANRGPELNAFSFGLIF
jgi:hypothetical protein